ncbi:MAG: ATP-binding protein [Chloroflexi bacterium]|nr:MAG: ATP-binding protein [Chloroflexota bacterium]
MPADPTLLKALGEALQKDPGSVPLRLHLATLLLDSGGESAALEHFVTVLGQEPANVDALRGAARAADMLGDSQRAQGYRQLLQALTHTAEQPKASEPPVSEQATSPQPEPSEGERVPAEPQSGDVTPWWEIEWPNLTLKDVGGMEQVKRRLNVAFLGPMRNPELRKAYGKSLRGGLLLYGPPGCGKTFLARATAGELGARFLGVGLSDVLDMWLGQSEKRLHEIFQHARRSAPCVLFFDELDAIGQKRVHLQHHGSMRNVVNQLLAEMSGVASDNEGVFLLGATNHPWDVDTALLRPGRFDRSAVVLPPDEPARVAILVHHLKGRPAEAVDVRLVASKTDGFSGADLAHLCETATENAMEDSAQTGTVRSISNGDFQEALRQVRPSTMSWFETARNFVLFANESGAYDDLLAYMKVKKLV